jgi:hypothetical protein
MEHYYRTNDWERLASSDSGYIDVKGFKVPYAVFQNEPEKTHDPELTGKELERAATRLWSLRQQG